jgi:uncharacterized protein (TIGR02246 family)
VQTRNARWTLPLILTVLMGACTSQPKAPTVDTGAATAAVDSLNQAFTAAVAARDTNAVANFYAPDAQVLAPGMPRADGRDSIRTFWAGLLRTPGLDLKITSSHPTVTQAGDMIIDVGSYAMNATDAKGKPIEDVGKYVTIFKKVDGEWKIIVDMVNSDKPGPGM